MSEDEKAHLATLESVEKDLLSQGFVPLQPGALSSIAQESGYAASASLPEQPINAVVENAPELVQTQDGAPEQAEPVPVAQAQQETPAPVPATNGVEHAAPAAPSTPAYRPDALLESELETTMKRPAVRLQPIQAGAARANAKGHPADRKPGAGENALSHKEQLVKGYQYQLAGAYDDAMQEYRVTIRNAPELLDEVISNLRALLKLAPRYTTGYRVLGDAYMRQGQYLQAMEAYNKALTMAKKAKSQSH
jgi:tetratricopeptide (TPR) repeat protein